MRKNAFKLLIVLPLALLAADGLVLWVTLLFLTKSSKLGIGVNLGSVYHSVVLLAQCLVSFSLLLSHALNSEHHDNRLVLSRSSISISGKTALLVSIAHCAVVFERLSIFGVFRLW